MKLHKNLILLFVIFLAVFFRFNNLNWDQGHHLHPDERFLTMVGNAMKTPSTISDYLNAHISSLNPQNVGFRFFVYGAFPVVLNKIFAAVTGQDTYNNFTLLGRTISAFFDALIVILVYKTITLLFKNQTRTTSEVERVALWGAFFYGVAVLPIQLSHFFAVDTFLNFFAFASFYLALRKKRTLSAVFFAFAAASKISAFLILPLNLFFILKDEKRNPERIKQIFVYLFVAYIALRLANPAYFESANLFNPAPNKIFVENLQQLKSFEGKDIWYPPGVQWINKPKIVYSLVNLAAFGVGFPYFILILIGIFNTLKSKIINLKSMLFWTGAFFLYQSTQFAQTMRYFIMLYPFLAIFAALGTYRVIGSGQNFLKKILRNENFGPSLITSAVFLITLVWPLSFSSIYFQKHSRVVASEWIYQNLPNKSVILAEHWDDALPISVDETFGKEFTVSQLPVFDQDTNEKWQKMNKLLVEGDYYVLSSNRGWGSIMDTPDKYPKMSKFYRDLLTGKTQYKKIKEFTSYPSFTFYVLRFTFPDDSADESFTVYDHPKVIIFKKSINE